MLLEPPVQCVITRQRRSDEIHRSSCCIVCIVAHELHLLFHPGGGRSAQSMVLIWPRRFQFGVYYAGFMKRSRWLVMRLAPLTLLPTLLLLLTQPSELSFFWQQFVVLAVVVNGLGADRFDHRPGKFLQTGKSAFGTGVRIGERRPLKACI